MRDSLGGHLHVDAGKKRGKEGRERIKATMWDSKEVIYCGFETQGCGGKGRAMSALV